MRTIDNSIGRGVFLQPSVVSVVCVGSASMTPASVSPHQRHAPPRGESRSYLGCLGRGFRGLSGHVTSAGDTE